MVGFGSGRLPGCDCPPINAEHLDALVRLTPPATILDFDRFLAAAVETHDRELAAVNAQITAALAELDKLDTGIGRAEETTSAPCAPART
jgi:hypothetical protein